MFVESYLQVVSIGLYFMFQTFLELCGLYAVCDFYLVISATNAGPLSLPVVKGRPYLGSVFHSRTPQNFVALEIKANDTDAKY